MLADDMLTASRHLTSYHFPGALIKPCIATGSLSLTRILTRSISRNPPAELMKRKATASVSSSKAKRQRELEPDYCDAKSQRAEDGSVLWPASESAIEKARQFLKEWFVLVAYAWLIDGLESSLSAVE